MENKKIVLLSTPSPRCLRTRPLPQGARKTAHGFTLIELLVVVLIIGILAAVAVPQYQKAVAKSRVATVLPLLKSIGQAQQAYRMAHGTLATSFEELDIGIPWTGNEKISNHVSCKDVRSNGLWSVQICNASNGGSGIISVGQLTGKYAGTGFIYYVMGDAVMPNDSIACAEWTPENNGLTFSEEGDFCKKVMALSSSKRTANNYNGWAM